MPFLRSIWSDLLEKRLWPAAAVLVVALVAIVAVSIGGGSATPPAPAVANPAVNLPQGAIAVTPAGPSAAAAIVATTGGAGQQRTGQAHNPFAVQPGVNLIPAASASVKTTAASGASATSSSAAKTTTVKTTTTKTSTTSTPSTSTGTTGTTVTGKPVYRVSLGFGFPSRPQIYKDVAKLTPLPSAQNALLSFLGVRSNGKTVTFALLKPAIPSGPGNCRPSPANCQQLDMRQGQIESLYYVTPQLTVVLLQLTVTSVAADRSASAISAKAANGRQSRLGRAVLRHAAPAVLRAVKYSQLTGTLVAARHGA